MSEHHSFGQTDEAVGDYAEDLATMLATTMGIQFDLETAWDERKQIFRTSGLIIKTTNITPIGHRRQEWLVDNDYGSFCVCACKFLEVETTV